MTRSATEAEHYLFRSKRAAAMADLLPARRWHYSPHFRDGPTRVGTQAPRMTQPHGERSRGSYGGQRRRRRYRDRRPDGLRRIAPYNELVGGKLVAMLAVSPTVVRAYDERYGDYASLIAIHEVGRPSTTQQPRVRRHYVALRRALEPVQPLACPPRCSAGARYPLPDGSDRPAPSERRTSRTATVR